jgi:hypothetical protein
LVVHIANILSPAARDALLPRDIAADHDRGPARLDGGSDDRSRQHNHFPSSRLLINNFMQWVYVMIPECDL